MKPFKKLRGRAILLDVPQRKPSSIELSTKDEELIMQEAMKLWTRLNVFAIGSTVEEIEEGDKVYIRTASLEGAEKIEIDGEVKLLVSEGEVVLIW